MEEKPSWPPLSEGEGHGETCASCVCSDRFGHALAVEEDLETDTEFALPVHAGGMVVGMLTVDLEREEPPSGRRTMPSPAGTEPVETLPISPDSVRGLPMSHPALEEERECETVHRLLTAFASQLSQRAGSMVAHDAVNCEGDQIARAKRFVHAHLEQPIGAREVAAHVGTDLIGISLLFQRFTGLSCREYIDRLRLERAKGRLLHGEATLSEVAYSVGFSSLAHFSLVFREETGETPSAYRERRTGPSGGTVLPA